MTDLSKLREGDTFTPKSWDDAHPGRFLKYTDIELAGGALTLTVSKVHAEHMGAGKDGKPDVRNILSFSDHLKQYATQKTNESLIVAMFGPDPAAFVGKRITFVIGQDFRVNENKQGPCVRVGGSPDMTVDTLQHTVTYSRKTRRKPQEFTLRRTSAGGGARPAGMGEAALKTALASIADAAPEALPGLRETLREHKWSRDEGAKIAAAFGERGMGKDGGK